ncbi:hypothetical protein [Oceanispirochaeta sp.]|jgi:hypothetical protein|uniref:hypothetical protein n=1 Tax=Oceanispirochaeta sp. TaxID=2035350 RepID=UPI002622C746|nr:hypothetical protein [Oceanispirochaeta sp.]MDA3956317.1 hypothetical protein [Oceanispirochaeta sp.]
MNTGIGKTSVPEPIDIRPIQELEDITESYFWDRIEKEEALREVEQLREEERIEEKRLLLKYEERNKTDPDRAPLPDDMALKVDLLA